MSINIVIPMAGEGSRFAKAGYDNPKPFIDVAGKPMIQRVMENLYIPDAQFILIARKSHLDARPDLCESLGKQFNIQWVTVDQLTEGTACTVLFARQHIQNNDPMIIANSDQIVDSSIQQFVDHAQSEQANGSILCFKDPEKNPKWSFAREEDGVVVEVKEKVPISDLATVGIYYFSEGKQFVNHAIDMIVRNDRVNNEFYTCPVYNYLIKSGLKVITHVIHQEAMHGIGTPEDLQHYLSHTH